MTTNPRVPEQCPVALAFVQARRTATPVEDYPGDRPNSLAAAYAIQDAAIALDGRAIAGWKVGRIWAPLDKELGTNRLAGPIFADHVAWATTAGAAPAMPVFSSGFAAAEAEFLLHVAPGWGGQVPEDFAGVIALIDDVRIGIEIASSPYADINNDGPSVTVSDFGNNCGMVIGAPVKDWRSCDFAAVTVTTRIDDRIVGEATTATMLDGPFGAVQFLLAHLAARGHASSRGFWVSTGAITGVHEAAPGAAVEACFAGYGTVACTLSAARA